MSAPVIKLLDCSFKYPDLSFGSDSIRFQFLNQLFKKQPAPIKSYELKEIALDVYSGEKIGIIGHNGAGKTTLLKLMGGVLPATSGSIMINGTVTNLIDPAFGLDLEQTGAENIRNCLIYRGFSFKEAKESLEKIVNDTKLGDKIYSPVYSYSAGMMLRLSFCIAIYAPEDILIMDEVIGGGDRFFQEYAQAKIDKLFASGRVVILSSHNLDLIEKYCDKAVLMERGEIIGYGSVSKMIQIYKHIPEYENLN